MEDEEYQRQKEKEIREYNPELKLQARKEIDFSKILNNMRLTNEQKLMALSQLQHTLKPQTEVVSQPYSVKQVIVSKLRNDDSPKDILPHLKSELPHVPIVRRLFAEAGDGEDGEREDLFADASEDQPVISADARMKLAFDSLPTTYRTKSVKLFDFLKENPNYIVPSGDNELMIHGKAIEGSNFFDLLKFAYNPGNKSKNPPIGFSKFSTALGELKTPPELVSNKALSSFLKDVSQVGSGSRKRKIIAYAIPHFSKKKSLSKSISKSNNAPSLPSSIKLFKL